jgi:hypothetical protein
MFLNNKYSIYYFNITNRAKARTLAPDTYVEKHHIIPRSLGGSDDANNIVKLTAREHLVCHQLLIKMTTGIQKSKMAFAAWRMVFSSSKHKRVKVTSRVYQILKSEMATAARERSKSYRHSDQSKKKIAQSKTGKSRNVTWGDKISKANTGKKRGPASPEAILANSISHKGLSNGPMSESAKKKLSSSKTGGKIQIDPVTGRRYYVYATKQDCS